MSTCESAEDVLLKANVEFLDKNFKSALEQYNLSIQLDDSLPDSFVKRALCLEKLKRFSGIRIDCPGCLECSLTFNITDAVADCNKAISLDPMNFKAYYQKGYVLLWCNVDKLMI